MINTFAIGPNASGQIETFDLRIVNLNGSVANTVAANSDFPVVLCVAYSATDPNVPLILPTLPITNDADNRVDCASVYRWIPSSWTTPGQVLWLNGDVDWRANFDNVVGSVKADAPVNVLTVFDTPGYYAVAALIDPFGSVTEGGRGKANNRGENLNNDAPLIRRFQISSTLTPGPIRVADLGFRPDPNGYQFANWGSDAQNSDDFTLSDMRRMFGDSVVCQPQTNPCIPLPAATQWLQKVHSHLQGGHCDGFTTTALRLFKGLDSPASFQSGATTTHALLFANARRNIAYYWTLQMPYQGALARSQALEKTPSAVLNQIRAALENGAADPTTLIVYNADRTSGHSVLPYAIDDVGAGVYQIRVYDNNYPDDANRSVTVDTLANTWSYTLGTTMWWSGNATSHSFGALPLSVYAQTPRCPWCTPNGQPGGSNFSQVWMDGSSHLLITNNQGQQIGYKANLFTNTITDAFATAPVGGRDVVSEPIYYLPQTDSYTLHLNGQITTQALAQTVGSDIMQIGSGFALSVENLVLDAASQDTLTVSSDGRQVVYSANQNRSANLSLAYNDATASTAIQVDGADIGAGQSFTAQAQAGQNTIKLGGSNVGVGTYDLVITVLTATGETRFVYHNLTLNPGASHALDYSQLTNGGDTVTLTIDTNNDGVADSSEQLPNQAYQSFLPLIWR